jgi:hypothetical protein
MDAATIASLINFGSAGAVIIVVIIFLNYIGKRDAEWRDFFTVLNKNNVEDLGKLTKAIDSMSVSVALLGKNLKEHDDHVETRIKEVTTAVRKRATKQKAGDNG